MYGLQALKRAGAEVWAHRLAEQYFTSGLAAERLEQRKRDLFPWVDEHTRVVRPDVWLDGDTDFRLGGVTFRVLYSGGAHAPEDLLMFVVEERVLFAGDLLFAGRVPFVGNADSLGWLRAMDAIIPLKPSVVVPGHGPASRDVERDLVLTRDYLAYLRRTMGQAVADLRDLRRRVRQDRLVALQGPAGVRAREPHQRLRHVPADGAGSAEGTQAVSALGRPCGAHCSPFGARRITRTERR